MARKAALLRAFIAWNFTLSIKHVHTIRINLSTQLCLYLFYKLIHTHSVRSLLPKTWLTVWEGIATQISQGESLTVWGTDYPSFKRLRDNEFPVKQRNCNIYLLIWVWAVQKRGCLITSLPCFPPVMWRMRPKLTSFGPWESTQHFSFVYFKLTGKAQNCLSSYLSKKWRTLFNRSVFFYH